MDTSLLPTEEPPLAQISEIQFGLMTTEDICNLSINEKDVPFINPGGSQAVTARRALGNARLGLPTPRGVCHTCSAVDIDDCQGHFAHNPLPQPIFHPSHVNKLVTVLRDICLNCGKPKAKKRVARSLFADADEPAKRQFGSDTCPGSFRATHSLPVIDEGEDANTSGSDGDCTINKRKFAEVAGNKGKSVKYSRAASKSSRCPDLHSQGKEASCKYCSRYKDSDRYPNILLEIEIKENNRNKYLSKSIKMVMKGNQSGRVAPDFWSFVEHSKTYRTPVKTSRMLLPLEALEILKKIPKSAFPSLGLHPTITPPTAFIVECLPIPPSCLRIPDDGRWPSTFGFRSGSDRSTLVLVKLLNKIILINSRRARRLRKPSFTDAETDASELQHVYGLYLRELGAPKAVPGKDKTWLDFAHRQEKKRSRWSLQWLKHHVLGKRSSFSGRNVLTGDPFLKAEEIGIPYVCSRTLTIPERVNKWNIEKLQECIVAGETLRGRYRACGAVRIVRGTEKLEVTRGSKHQIKIGDVVHRHLKDGDLIYVNRPPSIHKHSLLALRVQVQDMPTFTINPAVCAPLDADFDGDCLHIFVPQSEEAKAEVHELMSMPEQILSSRDGDPILGPSQDNILASYLLAFTSVFISKDEMWQLALWGTWDTKRLPTPVIVKSARGSFWSGLQVVSLITPEGFTFGDGDSGGRNWLSITKGFMSIFVKHGSLAALNHLDCCQSVLREWLLSHGFSVSLEDFYVAADRKSRKKFTKMVKASINDATQLSPLLEHISEDIVVRCFLQHFSKMADDLKSSEWISKKNQLMAMVISASKGSPSKVLQQVGCLGLQLYKNEHKFNFVGNVKFENLTKAMSCKEGWESQGLVKTSLLDGLNPLEFYFHASAVRAGYLRQSLEVTKPGELFKNLMLFLRDIQVEYDQTVRSKSDRRIIQFRYGGGEYPTSMKASLEKTDFVVPGDAVGVLAGTAIAQPAYRVMLEANQNVGSNKIHPLALLQETLYPRSATKMKTGDRRVMLRLQPCILCSHDHCNEKRVLALKKELQCVPVQMIATAISTEFVQESSEEWRKCLENGVTLPWVGHIQLDQVAMIHHAVTMVEVVKVVETAFRGKDYKQLLKKSCLSHPVFFIRDQCVYMRAAYGGRNVGPCLHYSASLLKTKISKRTGSPPNKRELDFVNSMHDTMAPLILKAVVKGDQRIESTRVVWEEQEISSPISSSCKWSPPYPGGELVLEAVVKEKCTTSRGSPWSTIKEACALLTNVDWERSSPYSIQEIRHSLGVEAARDHILQVFSALKCHCDQRLTSATQAIGPSSVDTTHLKLVADLMVHTGDVNGLTYGGYRDQLRSLNTSAPFTSGAFRTPMKHFIQAGQTGESEILSGVLAASIFGIRVPVGTGADFKLIPQPQILSNSNAWQPVSSADALDVLGNLKHFMKGRFPQSPDAAGVEVVVSHDAQTGELAGEVTGWTQALERSRRNIETWMKETLGSSEQADGWTAEDAGGLWDGGIPESNWASEPSANNVEYGSRSNPMEISDDNRYGSFAVEPDSKILNDRDAEFERRQSKRDDPNRRKRTGANLVEIPPEKMRKFGNQAGTRLLNADDSIPRTQGTKRALDSRKDSKEWMTLVDTVRSVRDMLLKYEVGERLSPEDFQVVMTQVLTYHPSVATKVGTGVDYFKVANSNKRVDMERPSKCFFLVRTDGSVEDFSYHKCLKSYSLKTDPPLDDLYEAAFGRKVFSMSSRTETGV